MENRIPNKYRVDDALKAKWYATCERRKIGGISSLPASEQVWMGVRAVLDATGDGGVISYFYNHWADEIDNSLKALDAVGAPNLREQLENVAALFAGDSIKSMESRNEVINSWNAPGHERRHIDSVLVKAEENFKAMRLDLNKKLFEFLHRWGIATLPVSPERCH